MSVMDKAYTIATLAVRQRLAEYQPDALRVLDDMRPGDAVVYSGTFDQAETVLRDLGIPVLMDPHKHRLMNARIAFVNCSSTYNPTLLAHAREFVEQGGFLVTSDWSLHYVLEKSFPGLVR